VPGDGTVREDVVLLAASVIALTTEALAGEGGVVGGIDGVAGRPKLLSATCRHLGASSVRATPCKRRMRREMKVKDCASCISTATPVSGVRRLGVIAARQLRVQSSGVPGQQAIHFEAESGRLREAVTAASPDEVEVQL